LIPYNFKKTIIGVANYERFNEVGGKITKVKCHQLTLKLRRQLSYMLVVGIRQTTRDLGMQILEVVGEGLIELAPNSIAQLVVTVSAVKSPAKLSP
jgi:hypothetical protein